MKRKQITTIFSIVVMGGGHFVNKFFLKGLFFFFIGLTFIYNLPGILENTAGLITLGDTPQTIKGFDIVQGDHSILMMFDGVISVILFIFYALVYFYSIKDARRIAEQIEKGETILRGKDYLIHFYEENFPKIMLTPAILGTIFFTALPILITIMIAFTNYSAPNHLPPKSLVDWVGFQNFVNIIKLKSWAGTFGKLAVWTVIWAVATTFLNYACGLILALLTAKKGIKFKGFWRSIFVLPYAVPAFISLLVFRLMFSGVGPVNNFIASFGFEKIPFFTDPLLAKIMVILINTWAGAPYFMILISGSLTNISSSLYEAAEIDGATRYEQFRHITLPLLLFQTAPVLVLSFAYNFNNFGAIYLLTDGNPVNASLKYAGETDILVTWLYKLTLDHQQYGMAGVISIILFAFIASVSLYNFTRSKSFKEEDMI
ncbi:MAG: arabinogalactan oligomer / maltooligosaccharide transport system permease protein [Fusobacteriaceae bacterium]|jgi:arabinogalactan oligomer/maltooligosaccharide transport system permease protein|nr:arabinogalactan oligomer / maltooligosaccharide transport system permease protein [Fusobacteriaceae bacterium]